MTLAGKRGVAARSQLCVSTTQDELLHWRIVGPLKVGSTLSNKYKVERLLAESGGVILYEATDTARAKRVWIKILEREALANSAALARFQREAGGAKVLDVGKSEAGLPYMVASEFHSDEPVPKTTTAPARGNPKTTLPGVAPPPAPFAAKEEEEEAPPSSIPLLDDDDLVLAEETPPPKPIEALGDVAKGESAERKDNEARPALGAVKGEPKSEPKSPAASKSPSPKPPAPKPTPLVSPLISPGELPVLTSPLITTPPPPLDDEPEVTVDDEAATVPLKPKASQTPTIRIPRDEPRPQAGRWLVSIIVVASLTGILGYYLGRENLRPNAPVTTATVTQEAPVLTPATPAGTEEKTSASVSPTPTIAPTISTTAATVPSASIAAAPTLSATPNVTPPPAATPNVAANPIAEAKPPAHTAPPVRTSPQTTTTPPRKPPATHTTTSDPLTL